MSGTFTEPVASGPFGPFSIVSFQTDFIGPLQPGSLWTISLYEHGTENLWLASPPIAASSSHLITTWQIREDGSIYANPAFSGRKNGATGDLIVELLDPEFNVLDHAVQTITYEPTIAIDYALQLLQTNTADTPAIAGDVAAIKTASFATFGESLVPISQLLQTPPIGLLVRELIGDLDGEGTLTRPVGPFNVNAFGLAWEVIAAGEGIGVGEGAPDVLVTHMLDLQLVHTLADANNETTSIASFDYGDAMWLFNPMLPHEVKYWIGPSITLRMYWLLVV